MSRTTSLQFKLAQACFNLRSPPGRAGSPLPATKVVEHAFINRSVKSWRAGDCAPYLQSGVVSR
jgi:hypothetical protein